MNKSTDFLTRLEEYLIDCEDEHERVQQELREIDLLIRQSTAEVERLSQRNTQIRNNVASMEADLENYSREEIRAIYNAERDSQLRLFMMRSQVEQLQNKQRTLEKYVQTLQHFLNLVQGLPDQANLALPSPEPVARKSGWDSLSAIVFEAQEDERLALVNQVHNGPAQALSNLVLRAEICERLFSTDPEQARQELVNLKSVTNSTLQKVRDFIFELRPMMLDDLGLAPTLRRYLQNWEKKHPIGVHFQLMGQERRLPSLLEIALFRAVQELLLNVARYANASHVQVTLDLQGNTVTLVVEDNGSGFDVSKTLTTSPKQRRVGLAALRERVETLDGDISFDSAMGRGTRVTITVPIPEEERTGSAPLAVT